MQFCAKLGKIIEKTIKRCHKIQFFSWSSIKFFLNVHNFRVRELCEIRSFGYVFSYQFIGVFNAPFLPRRVCVRKIYLYIFLPFHIQSIGYQLMCCKLTAIVRGDGFDGFAIGKQLLYHSLGNRFRLFARRYALHQQHIGTTFHQRQYHMLLAI